MNKEMLVEHIAKNMSIREISRASGKSYTTVSYWLKKHGLRTNYGGKKWDGKSYKKWTDNQMFETIKISKTIAEVLRKIGLKVRAGNYDTFHRFVQKHKIDTSHFSGQGHGKSSQQLPLSEVCVENSSYSRTSIKRRLLKEGILKNECYICGLKDIWLGKGITMVIDHINGNSFDNRVDNIRMLCPNCDSQQPTFRGRNKRRKTT